MAGASPQPTTPKKSVRARAASATPAISQAVESPATPTVAAVASPTATPVVTDTPVASAGPSATPQPANLQPRLLSAVVSQGAFTTGQLGTFTVTTVGDTSRVDVYVTAGPGASAGPFTYSLARSTGDRWTGSFAAPRAPGQYYYTVGLYNDSGHRAVVENETWNFSVTAKPQSGSPQPLPADMPLAPGFSYGNPVAAVFNAEGHVVEGSEVVSTTNTAQNGGALGQYYVTHLARAGWTVDPSSVPASGAPSWSIVGTSGARVCVVQYAAGVLHLYYGTP